MAATVTGPRHDAAATALSHEVVRLTRASHALRAQLTARGRGEVEWSAYVLLSQLVREGPQRASALAETGHVDPSTVSRQVAQLVAQGLAERRPDPDDGRAVLLAATDAGRAAYDQQQERRCQAFARMLADWPTEDVCRLAELMARLNDSYAAHRTEILDAVAGDVDQHQETS